MDFVDLCVKHLRTPMRMNIIHTKLWVEDKWGSKAYIGRQLKRLTPRGESAPRDVEVINIANISIDEKGRGTFKELLRTLLREYDLPIYVESVLNDRLLGFLVRNDFQMIDDRSGVYSAVLWRLDKPR